MDGDTTKTNGEREIPVPVLTRSDIVYHVVGVGINSSLTLWGMAWLIQHWATVDPPWYVLALTLLIGLFFSDFFSGLLHWAFDTWFTENTPFLRRMVLIVREHHVHPQHIFRYKFYYEAGSVSWASLTHTTPVIGLVTLPPGPASLFDFCAVIASVMVSTFTLFMLQFHKLGHRRSELRVIRALQRSRLLMGPRHHGQHHRDNHDVKYCLINGWADFVMDRIGFWRGVERVIHRLTGAIPRGNDIEWMKRYGRHHV